jgi:hypothetical protein
MALASLLAVAESRFQVDQLFGGCFTQSFELSLIDLADVSA